MKWLTVRHGGAVRHGYLDGETVRITGDGDLTAVVDGSESGAPVAAAIPVADAEILAPLLNPGKVLAVAANYQEHVVEAGSAERDQAKASPRLFLKPVTSIQGSGAPVVLDPITHELDWEVELAVVIGRPARNVAREDALAHVFGYATSNDISARSLDLGFERDGEAWTAFFDWLEGKWLDGSAPLGPYLVTADEVPDPQSLAMSLRVGDVVHQNSTTAGMIHSVAELVAFSSRLMTLEPGDVILTGTPAGVGAASGTYLKAGDVMVAEIEGLGTLVTPVVTTAPQQDNQETDSH
jgi:2-keto-4-pentenoate hydratase/2-oxohepta-3-ene-1,7-dioic acid hydratase in catechol pathway